MAPYNTSGLIFWHNKTYGEQNVCLIIIWMGMWAATPVPLCRPPCYKVSWDSLLRVLDRRLFYQQVKQTVRFPNMKCFVCRNTVR